MEWHIVHDVDGVIRSQIGDTGDGQAEAHDDRVLAKYPGGGVVIADGPADPQTQMVADGAIVARPPEPALLTQAEFIQRFTAAEQAAIMTTPELAPLALAVLAAPSRMVDVTDATAQQARAALEGAGWSQERLDVIFAVVG